MLTLNRLKTIFAEKLQSTGSLDEALLKVAWVSYKEGIKDGVSTQVLPVQGEQGPQGLSNSEGWIHTRL